METNVVLALVMGLPGAGKSTTCKDLASNSDLNVIHICFDDIIPISLQKKWYLYSTSETEIKDKSWKSARENVYQTVDNILSDLATKFANKTVIHESFPDKEISGPMTKFANKTVIHESFPDKEISGPMTKFANKTVIHESFPDKEISGPMTKFANKTVVQGSFPDKEIKDDTLNVILLDDNFYYRSMRYEYFRLARKHEVGFIQLYLKCPIAIAVQRNLKRNIHIDCSLSLLDKEDIKICSEQIPESVILNMARKLEEPNPESNHWESNSICIDVNNIDLAMMRQSISQNFKYPIKHLKDFSDEKNFARNICSNSLLHQVDLLLRGVVSQLIKESKNNGYIDNKYCLKINEARKSVLKSFGNGLIKLPHGLHFNEGTCNNDELRELLLKEIKFCLN